MKSLFDRFRKARRGAVALIFALTLVPLVLLVGLSVDYAFYVQARAQTALAADAAVTHAVRAADETYAYEEQINGTSAAAQAAAATEAEAAGSALGEDWFEATLGRMPKASVTGTPVVSVTPSPNGAAGFTATVNFAATYPPFFARLFNGKVWNVNGSAQATSAYNYVEILMLLDNSPSMLIGADAPDIQKLETISVCPPSSIDGSFDGNGWGGAFYQDAPDVAASGGGDPAEGPPVTANNVILNYTPGKYLTTGYGNSYDGKGYETGTCASGWTGPGGSPFAPCAFACHTTTNTMTLHGTNSTTFPFISGTYPADYYGLARAYSMPNASGTGTPGTITLRLDVVHDAASQVITAMETNEAASGQFSVGVYQFNDDVVPIWPAAGNGSNPQSEASTDLPDAAAAITSAALPLTTNPSVGYTDFPTSVADLISGKYSTGGQFGNPLTMAGNGATSTTPEKDIFIVTDGMQDTSDPGYREFAEMTGYDAENASSEQSGTPWVCQPLKNLGFTVYVLYIDYVPLSNVFYQTAIQTPSPYLDQDYPSLATGSPKQWAESTAASQAKPPGGNAALTALTPDETALYACASSPSDFFEATNSSQIGTAMNAMLQSALTSSIQLTK
jgi:Flp pilus assembly protein TadG